MEHVATSQGVLKIAGTLPDAGRDKKECPYRFKREHGPDNTLISDFCPPEL